MKKNAFIPFLRLGLTVSLIAAVPHATSSAADQTPGTGRQGAGRILRTQRPLQNQYIVVLHDWAAGPRGDAAIVSTVAGALTSVHGGIVDKIYRRAILGFSVRMPEAAARLLSLDPRVEFVEEDGIVEASTTQTNPTWGLDRIDQRNLPFDSQYTYTPNGTGVKVYVIDTGIRFSHNEFGGRATSGFDAIDGGSADDCHGHGTHVAGTIGGATYGVAKNVSIVAVRVLNCQGSGTNSQVIAGIDWVTGNHSAGQPAVANMSLGGGASTALDNAVRTSIADGLTYAIAAGNSNTSACNSSPARTAEAITVGATTNTDARSSFSNYGTCLDIFAPGSSITSAWYTSNTATNTISGTSMAAPHVAGVAALYLQDHPSASPQVVRDQIVNTATTGVVTNPGTGSPNRLLYSLLTGAPPPPPPPPPPPACTTYTGTLSGTGDADIQPNGTYYQSVAGTHSGTLAGPTNADFDLALYRWSGFGWSRVAVSQSSTSNEAITYNGTTGYYYWRIYSYSGAGSYTFCLKRP